MIIGSIQFNQNKLFKLGLSRFKTDIRAMVASKHLIHDIFMILWEISWTFFTPGLLTVNIKFLIFIFEKKNYFAKIRL